MQGSSLVGSLAAARAEQLKLTRAMLRNLELVEDGSAPVDVVFPILQPDPEKAAAIEREIATVKAEIEEAEAEAARYSGGLVLAMILSRIETSRLQLAQFRAALIEAQFGIPMTGAGLQAATVGLKNGGGAGSGASPYPDPGTDAAADRPAWADPEHPEIDYMAAPFPSFDPAEHRFAGWWAIRETTAAIDDSKKVVAYNLSGYDSGIRGKKFLVMQCVEGQIAIIFRPDEFLAPNMDTYRISTIYRIDDAEARRGSWNSLTDNQGAGLFGSEAEALLDSLKGGDRFFVRLIEERNGEQHDATFDLAGTADVVRTVRQACH